MVQIFSTVLLLCISLASAAPLQIQDSEEPERITNATALNCECDTTKMWMDLILVIDASDSMGEKQFNSTVKYLKEALLAAPIGQQEGHFTRVGIILYGNGDSEIQTAKLDEFQSSYQFYTKELQYIGGEGTNLGSAINAARDQFADPNLHRPNTRKVILVAAGTYRAGPYDDPLTISTTFRANRGEIIVLAYDNTSEVLRNISSPGAYVDASKGLLHGVVVDKLCKANCFCPHNFFADEINTLGEPVNKCYLSSDLPSVNFLSQRFCSMRYNGTLVMPKDSTQIQYVLNKYRTDRVWLGLHNLNGTWTWEDSSQFSGQMTGGTGTCATIRSTAGFKAEIDAAECSGAYVYMCEVFPCSSTNYCPVLE